jgi:hypothetical protein
MTFKDLGCANCQNCFVKQKEYCDKNNLTFCELFQKEIYSDLICDIHIKNTTSEESNVINMYKEEKHFEFQEYCFLDDNLQLLENIVSKIIHYPYAGLYPTGSPEMSYINQNDCNRQGVQAAQAQVHSAVHQYHRA